MKDQVRTIEAHGLKVRIGWWSVELDDDPEARAPLCEVLMLHSRGESDYDAPRLPKRGEAARTIAAIETRQRFGDQYYGGFPLQAYDRLEFKPYIDAYEKVVGRPLGDDAYIIKGTNWSRRGDYRMGFAVPTATLLELLEQAEKYWEDWAADPPEPPPYETISRQPEPTPEPEPRPPFDPTEGDAVFLREDVEPRLEQLEAADAAGAPITGYVRVVTLGLAVSTVLDVRGEGVADKLRAFGLPSCARFHEAALALDAYYRAEVRRDVTGVDVVPPILDGPVSLDLFRLGAPTHALVARAEKHMRDAPPEGDAGEEIIRDDQGLITIRWRNENGLIPAIVSITS